MARVPVNPGPAVWKIFSWCTEVLVERASHASPSFPFQLHPAPSLFSNLQAEYESSSHCEARCTPAAGPLTSLRRGLRSFTYADH